MQMSRGAVDRLDPLTAESEQRLQSSPFHYLGCLSVGRDDAEGSGGRLGARGAAGADCCHGDGG